MSYNCIHFLVWNYIILCYSPSKQITVRLHKISETVFSYNNDTLRNKRFDSLKNYKDRAVEKTSKLLLRMLWKWENCQKKVCGFLRHPWCNPWSDVWYNIEMILMTFKVHLVYLGYLLRLLEQNQASCFLCWYLQSKHCDYYR